MDRLMGFSSCAAKSNTRRMPLLSKACVRSAIHCSVMAIVSGQGEQREYEARLWRHRSGEEDSLPGSPSDPLGYDKPRQKKRNGKPAVGPNFRSPDAAAESDHEALADGNRLADVPTQRDRAGAVRLGAEVVTQ